MLYRDTSMVDRPNRRYYCKSCGGHVSILSYRCSVCGVDLAGNGDDEYHDFSTAEARLVDRAHELYGHGALWPTTSDHYENL